MITLNLSMVPELDRLSASEVELVYKTPLLVCILIAGADGKIDKKEIKEAMSFAEKKHKRSLSSVSVLFKEISMDFEDKLKSLIQSYPYESTQRTPLVIQDLAELNLVWGKLSKNFSAAYYEMLKSLAEKVASSSGGIWGMKKIAAEEAKYLGLPMLSNPAHLA